MTPYSTTLWLGLILAAHGAAPALAQEAPAPDDPVRALPIELLGRAYVDLHNGFSVRPPFGSELAGRGSAKAIAAGDLERTLPDLTNWDLLKRSVSKALVRFVHPASKSQLYVYLLVTRQKMDIEHVLDARQNYWQNFSNQITPEFSETDTISEYPVALTRLIWQDAPEAKRYVIREAVIQQEMNRYFLCELVTPLTDEAQSSQDDVVAEAIVNNFLCLSKSKVRSRREQSRKRAQDFLGGLDAKKIQEKLRAKNWYRIVYKGKDVGFHVVEERVPRRSDPQQAIEVKYTDYIHLPSALLPFARMQGWRIAAPGTNGQNAAFTGPIRLDTLCQLNATLDDESFTFQITDLQDPTHRYCEQGRWSDGQVRVADCAAESGANENPSETLDLSDHIGSFFLPLTQAGVLGQLIELKVGQEYTFVRYMQRGLGYYSLRVVAHEQLKVPSSGAETGTSIAFDGQPSTEIDAIYLVGQMNTEGPIIEQWLGPEGQLLIQKAHNIVLIKSHPEKIKQLWSDQIADPRLFDTQGATSE